MEPIIITGLEHHLMAYGDIVGKNGTAKQTTIPEAVDADNREQRTSILPIEAVQIGEHPTGKTTIEGVQRFAKSVQVFKGKLR